MAQAVSLRPSTAETRFRSRGQSMWDLWRTKWHWDRFFPEYVGFPLSISFHRHSITRKNEKKNWSPFSLFFLLICATFRYKDFILIKTLLVSQSRCQLELVCASWQWVSDDWYIYIYSKTISPYTRFIKSANTKLQKSGSYEHYYYIRSNRKYQYVISDEIQVNLSIYMSWGPSGRVQICLQFFLNSGQCMG
jgi:hypothetical protein